MDIHLVSLSALILYIIVIKNSVSFFFFFAFFRLPRLTFQVLVEMRARFTARSKEIVLEIQLGNCVH